MATATDAMAAQFHEHAHIQKTLNVPLVVHAYM